MNAILIDTLKAVRNSCCRAISVAKISDWIWCCSSWLEWRSRVSIMPLSTRQAMADRQWWFSSTEAFCSRHDIPTHWHHYQHAHLSIIHTLQEGGRAEGPKGRRAEGEGREKQWPMPSNCSTSTPCLYIIHFLYSILLFFAPLRHCWWLQKKKTISASFCQLFKPSILDSTVHHTSQQLVAS